MAKITMEIPSDLVQLATSVGTTPEHLLQSFIADLCELPSSNGSDERRHADAWFNRLVWPIMDLG